MATPLLYKARLDDESEGPDVVEAHNELEGALGAIFGIRDGANVTDTIFGTVDGDGSFTLIRFTTDGPKSAATAPGFVWQDGSVTKKLGFVDSKIEIWHRTSTNPDVWVLMYDYETVVEPDFHELTDVFVSSYTAGKVFAVQTDELGLREGDENALSQGYTKVLELDDVASEFDLNSGPWGTQPGWAYTGSALAVSADGTQVVPADISNTASYSAHFKAAATAMALIGNNGNGTWTTMGPWAVGDGSSSSSLTTIDGKANAGIRLDKGIYRVRPSWVMRSGTSWGWMAWRLIGTGFSEFPKVSPNLHQKHMPARFYYTQDQLLHNGAVVQSLRTCMHDSGEIILIAPGPITFGVQMGCSVSGHSLQPLVSVERII